MSLAINHVVGIEYGSKDSKSICSLGVYAEPVHIDFDFDFALQHTASADVLRACRGEPGLPQGSTVSSRSLDEALFHRQPCLFVFGHAEYSDGVYCGAGGVVGVVSVVVCVCG